ncbi:SMODS domain-containing nucleotidyltransferase [Vagococcus fluvialis]|uniref:Nucleotidyltransferase n=1 Tax=Vagococcus fluvialis TaxID=2738 RepID=A0A7X6I3P9_9ENTE|nr:nucleotidyltransferase domain-containing protein [Vagococcus fluvialis]NKC68049.1 nucleotidyltransferase [Vagococcus fluvialis]
MNYFVTRHPNPIPSEKRQTISKRYHVVTQAINREFWNSESNSTHSFYVGSYGRGTAINTSDIDILVELPLSEYEKFNSNFGNGPSRLLQAVRTAIKKVYSRSDIRADGQIIKINFYDGIQFELLPAFKQIDFLGNSKYIYPDSNMGGSWKSTNPKSEQDAMKLKNSKENSNGLLYATCKHLRFIRDTYYKSYKLSGIAIDSFVFTAMGNWRYLEDGAQGTAKSGDYEKLLLDYYNARVISGMSLLNLTAPGSGQSVDVDDSFVCLGKVLNKINS